MTAARRPTVVDLYSGAGGLSLGMEQAGFDVLGAVELDPVHSLVHKYNFPRTALLVEDMKKVSADRLLQLAETGWDLHGKTDPFPGLDAIVGGPPCQGFSVGGVRDPYDSRNSQIDEFVRLVVECRPRAFCLENVAGLLEPRFEVQRQKVTRKLRRAGYRLDGWETWNDAQDFGVPQRRRRVFLVGSLDRTPPNISAFVRGAAVTVAEAFKGLPELDTYPILLHDDEAPWREGERLIDEAALGPYAAELSGVSTPADKLGYVRTWTSELITGSRITTHSADTVARFKDLEVGTVDTRSRLYRLKNSGVAPTLRAGSGPERGSHTSPRPIHPSQPRVITVREAARLHGYPDWFRFHTTNWHGHRQVGNSVPPPLAYAAGNALLAGLDVDGLQAQSGWSLGNPAWLRQSNRSATILLAESDSTPTLEK